jgi:hypothetical protein
MMASEKNLERGRETTGRLSGVICPQNRVFRQRQTGCLLNKVFTACKPARGCSVHFFQPPIYLSYSLTLLTRPVLIPDSSPW